MKKYLLSISLLGLAACAQQEPLLCDRENIDWDKYGTAEVPQRCEPKAWNVPVVGPRIKSDCPDCNRVGDPPMVGPPVSQPPTSKPPETVARVRRNNGLGNGDQPAPGRSLDRNRAENQRGAPGHASGKAQRPN